jgi:hypothetical protein
MRLGGHTSCISQFTAPDQASEGLRGPVCKSAYSIIDTRGQAALNLRACTS